MEKEYLVKKWLNNDLSEAEAKSFEALDDANLYNEIIEEAQLYSGNKNAKVAPFNELESLLTTEKKVISINWMKTISSIAAALLVGFAVFSILNKDTIETFGTEYAQNKIITLPDNSIVNLNQFSQLEYNSSKWDEARTLNLSGEAYFDVEKGKRFDVKTDQGTVSVLGTEFNVVSRDSLFKVTCYEGLVSVNYDNTEIKVPAGTEFVLKAGKSTKTDIVIAEPYWIKNMSVFDNVIITDVFSELEKRYNIKVIYNSDVKLYFNGAFEHNNLENALKSVTQPLNLTFKLSEKEVIIRNANKN
ncbi:FecR family protein [Winogradskyella echinorum]|uniref:FecR family protein n=1 Tax=Winogradskyella echinorum TaxID=538189 RepID=A0ABR6XYY1_9FLAO|nr:FecR family protein [Winogradskyella echinorum]MBC3845629.1 FecR family protein [Winogradskyella echinorum]MBC5749977.1 FecR family protein [Winogradskyella echinorum]